MIIENKIGNRVSGYILAFRLIRISKSLSILGGGSNGE